MANLPRIQPELALKYKFPDVTFEYTERDVALYALGVGAAGENPVDPLELPFVYHPEGQTSITVLPTFAVVYVSHLIRLVDSIDGLHYDPNLLLHGEHYTEIYKPLPTCGQIRSSVRISGLHDKGKAAIVEIELLSHDSKTGDKICLSRITIFLRGAGGFSPSSQPFSYSNRTTYLPKTTSGPSTSKSGQPEGAPDVVYHDQTRPSQALIYRLSGDYNPLHSDPLYATQAGFQRPILHGLCTLGYAVRAVIRSCCKGDATRIQSFQGRFLSHVYPGEKLTTEMWLDASQSRVSYKTKADGRAVLAGTVLLTPVRSLL
ncbi:unnamed protein product [Calypogeia fissa]